MEFFVCPYVCMRSCVCVYVSVCVYNSRMYVCFLLNYFIFRCVCCFRIATLCWWLVHQNFSFELELFGGKWLKMLATVVVVVRRENAVEKLRVAHNSSSMAQRALLAIQEMNAYTYDTEKLCWTELNCVCYALNLLLWLFGANVHSRAERIEEENEEEEEEGRKQTVMSWYALRIYAVLSSLCSCVFFTFVFPPSSFQFIIWFVFLSLTL